MKLSSLVFGFLVWASVVALSSLWIGFWNLFPIPILLLSAFAAFFAVKKWGKEIENMPLPKSVLVLCLLMLGLAAYPLLLVHPFFPASSDVLHITNIRILNDKIPGTYAPYSDLKFTYQIGFALFSNAVSKLFFFVSDYQIVWFLGLVFSVILVALVYWMAFALSKNHNASLISAALLIGTKVIFQNFYYGVFPLLASFALFIGAWYFFEKKSPLAFLLLPATIVFHPATGPLLALFLAFKTIQKRDFKFGLGLLLSACLSIPAILLTYLPVFTNAPGQLASFSLSGLWAALIAVPLWFGLVPLVLFLLSAVFSSGKKSSDAFIFSVVWLLFYLFFSAIGLPHSDKFFFLFSLFAVIFAGTFFATFVWEKFEKRHSGWKPFQTVLLLIVLLCLASFFASSDLAHARSGSKATVQDEAFALAFKKFDPALKKTLFLADGGGWIAAVSNKIPFDPLVDHFLPDSVLQVVSGSDESLNREKIQKQIEAGCISCINQTEVEYVVFNTGQFNFDLGRPPVFEFGAFKVYKQKR
ncbi:MAG: hypothetical protein V1777_05495 [Candidatus Micrarchaeota archaeon]